MTGLTPTTRSALTTAALLTLAAMPAYSATLYWDGATPAGDPNGGAGTWNNLSTANWDTKVFGGTDSQWNNANNDTAVFGGTASTSVNLGENIAVGGITFDTTGYTINMGANTLTLGATNNTVSFGSVAAATITGTIASTGNFILSGNPAVGATLTLNSTGDGWAGSTTVNTGRTLALANTSKALVNTSAININGGTVNFQKNGTIGNQISDTAGITFNGGGTFQQTNTTAGPHSETIGAVTVASGQANIGFTNGASSGAVVLSTSGITRSVNTAALAFTNANTAQTSFRVTGEADTAASEIVGPWATFGSAAGTQTDYAIYSGGNGTVVGRNIGASTESTWSTVQATTSNYTLANAAGSAVNGRLTATRNVNSVRNTTTATALTSVDTGTETITVTGSTFSDGDVVTIGGTAPGGLTTGVPYYVVSASGATFK